MARVPNLPIFFASSLAPVAPLNHRLISIKRCNESHGSHGSGSTTPFSHEEVPTARNNLLWSFTPFLPPNMLPHPGILSEGEGERDFSFLSIFRAFFVGEDVGSKISGKEFLRAEA